MRKMAYLGLLALFLSFLSSGVLASNAAECDVLKDPGHDLYAPTMYGLCVAWHNANENARVAIGDKFYDRAGFAVPGSPIDEPAVPDQPEEPDFVCLCWDQLQFEDICALGEPQEMVLSPGQYGFVTFYDGNVDAGFNGYHFDTFKSCAHYFISESNPELNDGTEILDLGPEESADCQAELETIATLYLDPICTGSL